MRKSTESKGQAEMKPGQDSVSPVPAGPVCPDCQQEMRYIGMTADTVSREVGEVTFERGYFYCDQCRRGLFLPGPTSEAND